MNKKGQFFLIATIAIVGLIIGFGTMYNSVKSSPSNEKADILLSQLQYEISQVLDNAAFNDKSMDELISNLNSTLDIYSNNNPDTEFAVVSGSSSEIISGTAYNKYYSLVGKDRIIKSTLISIPSENKATLELSTDELYDFPIKQQNLYLIVKVNNGAEKQVSQNIRLN